MRFLFCMFEEEVKLAMEPETYSRKQISYQDISENFRLKAKDFGRQYSHIYSVRLMKYKEMLESAIKAKWGNPQK